VGAAEWTRRDAAVVRRSERAIVVSETVFSMGGDLAPIDELVRDRADAAAFDSQVSVQGG
jgi:7-keto-8-aminopelargonate synthetase-like enzyme